MSFTKDQVEELLHLESVYNEKRRTAFIGKVVKYYLNNGSAYVDVQPVNKYLVESTKEILLPSIIYEVPLLIPRTGSSIDLYPVQKGDIGLCVVSDRCIDDFIDGAGDPIYSNDGRVKDANDAEFLLGGYPFSVEYSNTLPESCRAVIVDSNKSKLFIGDDRQTLSSPLSGKLDLFNLCSELASTLATVATAAGDPTSATKATAIKTALDKLKV